MVIIDGLVNIWLKRRQKQIDAEWKEFLITDKIPVPGDIFGYFSDFPERLPGDD